MAYVFFPELNHYFNYYWLTYGEMSINNVPMPAFEGEYPNDALGENSIFEMLFSNGFSSDVYNYMFDSYNFLSLNRALRERLRFKASTVNVYVTSEEGVYNTLKLSDEDLGLLDKLLIYRNTGTVDLSDITYDELEGTFPKLIYLYLDLSVNMSYENLNSVSVMSESTDLISSMFEFYLLNEAHRIVKNWTSVLENVTTDLLFKRWVSSITLDDEVNKKVFIPYVPYLNDQTYVYIDGILLESTQYKISVTGDGFYVSWEDTGESFKEDQKLVVEYFVESGD